MLQFIEVIWHKMASNMFAEMGQDTVKNNKIKKMDMATESMFFEIENDSNVIISRNTTEYFADRPSYTAGDTAVIQFNTKNHFMYGPNCRLEGRLEIVGDANARISTDITLGHSVMAVFKRLILRSGSFELASENKINKRVDMVDNMSCPRQYMFTQGANMGYVEEFPPGVSRFVLGVGFDDFSIPLHHVLGFFSQTSLIPTGLMKDGLRFEFELESASRAIVWIGAAQQYFIKDLRIVSDEYHLSDLVLGQLIERELHDGIKFSYETYKHKEGIITKTGTSEFDIDENVNRALSFLVRISSNLDEDQPTAEYLRSIFYQEIRSWRVKLGKEYMPKNYDVTNVVRSYQETLKAFNNLANCVQPPSVKLIDYFQSKHTIGVDLEKNNVSSEGAAGVKTTRRDNLRFIVNVFVGIGEFYRVHMFVHYQKVVMLKSGKLIELF